MRTCRVGECPGCGSESICWPSPSWAWRCSQRIPSISRRTSAGIFATITTTVATAWKTAASPSTFLPLSSQSYLNPVAYLPYCWAVDHLKPLAAGILFGALAGLNLGLLYQSSFAALAGLARRHRVGLALLTAVAGVWSPFFLLLVGSSFTETWTPLLVMLALLALLRDAESPSWRLVFAAGLALGAAAGFKLVNGVFALALLLTIGTTFRRPGFFRRVAGYLAGAAVAFLLVSGPWAFTLQRDFGSPLFPFYNAIFKSPYFPAVNFADERWQVTTLAGALDHPFDWAANAGSVSSEAPFRDLRFALFAILLLPALAVSIRPDKSATRETQSLFNPTHRSLLLWFFALSYLLWLYVFGVMRYAVPLELLSTLAILALCDCLIANRAATQRVFVVLALVGIAWVRVPAVLPRPDWGSTWFETTIPRGLRAAHALYVMSDSAPSAYLAPMLPADSRFVRLEVNLHIVPPDRYLGPRALSVIDNHAGPLRVLEGERFNLEALSAYGLSVNLDDCLTLHTFADQFNFCSAYRTADGVRLTVPLVHAPLAAQQAAAFYSHAGPGQSRFPAGSGALGDGRLCRGAARGTRRARDRTFAPAPTRARHPRHCLSPRGPRPLPRTRHLHPPAGELGSTTPAATSPRTSARSAAPASGPTMPPSSRPLPMPPPAISTSPATPNCRF